MSHPNLLTLVHITEDVFMKISQNYSYIVFKHSVDILNKDTTSSLQSTLSKNQTKLHPLSTEAGGHSARADTGWSGPGWGHLQCLQPAATQSLWQETVFNSSRWKFFSPSSLGNQEHLPFEKNLLGRASPRWKKTSALCGGGVLWGRLRTRCHQTRGLGSGRASSSSRTYCPACWGRAWLGTWRGRAAGAWGGS